MKSRRLDGSIYGWFWLVGWCLILFGGAMWAVIGFLAGEVVGSFTLIAPALAGTGILTVLAVIAFQPRPR
jgi:hypothetical protein